MRGTALKKDVAVDSSKDGAQSRPSALRVERVEMPEQLRQAIRNNLRIAKNAANHKDGK